jgi:hypothetical protein
MTQLLLHSPMANGTGASGHALLGHSVSSPSSQEIAIIYLVSIAALGTGGVAVVDWAHANARTSPFTIVREGKPEADNALATADRVLLLRRWFSLSVAETARVLQVQRPTIYSWQDGRAPAGSRHLERLGEIFDLAREWRSMSPEPVGNRRKEPLGPSGRTLVDLLSTAEIPRARVRETMRRIAAAQQQRRRPASGAELAKRFGFKPLRESEVAENVARATSRNSRKRTGDS